MKQKFALVLIIISLIFAGCSQRQFESGKLKVAATTTMLADLCRQVGGDKVSVIGIMNTGVDPHSYNPTLGDNGIITSADVVIASGLHLEGKMLKIFDYLERKKVFLAVGDKLHKDGAPIIFNGSAADPHFWFDIDLWKEAARFVAEIFSEADQGNADYYAGNLQAYLEELDSLDAYVISRIGELASASRRLVTAHDAFSYFARAYGFEVKGIQGINTATEASTSSISNLAGYLTEHNIKAVFAENSAKDNTVRALIEAAAAKGHSVSLGGKLYTDSLGGAGASTYINAYKYNIDTIVDALKGTTQ